MASRGTVRLSDVWSALDECLPGHRVVEKVHHWWVYPPDGGPPFRRVPKGAHSGRARAVVERGHIRKLARQFGALDCMTKAVPGL